MRERPVSINIFGALNIGLGLLGLAWVLLSKMFEGFGGSAPGPSMNSFLSSMLALWNVILTDSGYVLWSRISVPLDVAANLALVTAGTGLLLLKNWGRLVSIGYSVYEIVSAFLNLAVLFVVLHRVLAKALQAGTGGTAAIVMGAAVLGAVLTLAYPVLLVYFMTKRKVVLAFQPGPGSPL